MLESVKQAVIATAILASCAKVEEKDEAPESPPPTRQDRKNWTFVRLVSEKPCGYVRPESDLDGHVTLPEVRGSLWMNQGAPVIVSPTAVFLAGEPVATIVDGKILEKDLDPGGVPRLHEPLQKAAQQLRERVCDSEFGPLGRMVVFADAGVDASVLAHLFKTAERATMQEYELAVDDKSNTEELGSSLTVLIRPHEKGWEQRYPPMLYMQVSTTSVVISNESGSRESFEFGGLDESGLSRLAESARRRAREITPGNHAYPAARFSFGPNVTVGRLASVLAAVSGGDCDTDEFVVKNREKCWFPQRIYDPDMVVPSGSD